MKRKEIESPRIERQIITGMIVSDRFLKTIVLIYQPQLLQTQFTRIVAGWCMEYFKQFERAPGLHIQDIFYSHEQEIDADEADTISIFLESISQEFERAKRFNVDYVLKKAEDYFESTNLLQHADRVKGLVAKGRLIEAKGEQARYKSVEIPQGDGFNPYTNMEKIKKAFEHHNEPLFTFPGVFGDFINSQLGRDSFVGLMAPEKRGKTWFLMEFGNRAIKQKCNVAFFQVGDLSEDQQTTRFHIRLSGRSDQKKHCGEILEPIVDCEWNQDDTCTLKQRAEGGIEVDWDDFQGDISLLDFFKKYEDHEVCTYCSARKRGRFRGTIWYKLKVIKSPLNWREGFKMGKRFFRKIGNDKDFKLSCHPAETLSVSGIENILNKWESQQGFIPDVIIIDYADLLAPEVEDIRREVRHQQNRTWMKLRALSLKRCCLIITATQADAASYDRRSLTMKNFSESKTKYAHVTCMLSLNQLPEEKRLGLIRIGQIVVREDEFDIEKEIKILQCLKIGRPFLGSFL